MTDEEFLRYCLEDIDFIDFSDDERDRLIALARIGAAVQPRPISEAPKDGTSILAVVPPFRYSVVEWRSIEDKSKWSIDPEEFMTEGEFHNVFFNCDYHPTHFIPLSALPKPEETKP